MREGDVKCSADVGRFSALPPGGTNGDEGGFQKRVAEAIVKHFPSAVRLVRDQFPRYLAELPGDHLFRIGVALYPDGDMEKARGCLELAAEKKGSWQYKAMLLVSGTHEAVGNPHKAAAVIQDLLDRRPERHFRRQAMKRLMKLRPLSGTDANEP